METLQQISARYPTDKAVFLHYLENYTRWFENLRQQHIRLLELGVHDGGSLLMWRDYFPNAVILGLDINNVSLEDPTRRIRVYEGEQQDKRLLDKIAAENAPDGFDIVIDDCSHIGSLSRVSFRHLFHKHLKSGGLYVIEDWGCGYWDGWPDGLHYIPRKFPDSPSLHERVAYRLSSYLRNARSAVASAVLSRAKRTLLNGTSSSHAAGMVGFVKELIDECALEDIHHPENGLKGDGESRIREINVTRSHIRVIKK